MKEILEKRPVGRPEDYKDEYCEMLIKHMSNGLSFESFGAVAHCSKQTLYTWLQKHDKFLDAKKTGQSHLTRYYEEMGKQIATGNLRRLVSEEPIIENGKPVYDAQGNVLMRRQYAPTTANPTAWIFLCKNMLKWKDRHDISIADFDDTQKPRGMSTEQMRLRALSLLARAQELKANDENRTGIVELPNGEGNRRTRDVGPGNNGSGS